MFIASFPAGPWQANCYLVSVGDKHPQGPFVVVDPGVDAASGVEAALQRYGVELAGILLSHGHIDHVASAAQLAKQHKVPVWLHPADLDMLTRPVLGLGEGWEALVERMIGSTQLPKPADLRDFSDGLDVCVAGLDFHVLHAPGHTPGCVVMQVQTPSGPVLFSGDVLFAGSIGRTDLPGGDAQQMSATLRRLAAEVDPACQLLPGHGPATTMSAQLASNPYLNQEVSNS